MEQLKRLIRDIHRRNLWQVLAIYVAASWVVFEIVQTVTEGLGLPPWFPPFAALLLLIGLPIVLATAFVQEGMPPTGREDPTLMPATDMETGARPDEKEGVGRLFTWRNAILGGLAALALWGVAATGWLLLAGPPNSEITAADRPQSIAVLPFADLSPLGDQEYFSEGVAEEIRNSLSKLSGLHVVARSSSFQFKNRTVDIREIGRILDADAVLEGSVRKSRDRLRISAQLISSEDGYQIWSETYERKLADVFAIQEEIAAQIVTRIRGELTPVDSSLLTGRPTESTTAYDYYLQGNYQLSKRTPAAVKSAIEAYSAATDADPEFLAPRARIAYAYGLFADWDWPHPTSHESLIEKGLSLTEGVLDRDPRLADAWLARAYLLSLRDPVNLTGALEAFKRAITLNPSNAEAHHQYGQSLMVLGCFEEATAAYRRALAIEPRRAMTLVPLSALALKTGRLEEAMELADSAVAVDSTVAYAYAFLSTVALERGDVERSLAAAERALRLDRDYQIPGRSARVRALARFGDTTAARAELTRALESLEPGGAPSPTAARYIASAMIELRDNEAAIRLLERARPRGAWLWFYLLSPEFDPVRSDVRLRGVIEDARPSVPVRQRCKRRLGEAARNDEGLGSRAR